MQEFTNSGVNDITHTTDTNICVSLGWDKRVRVFDAGESLTDEFTPLAVINCDEYLHTDSLQSVLFLESNNQSLVSSSLDGRICIWKNFLKHFL